MKYLICILFLLCLAITAQAVSDNRAGVPAAQALDQLKSGAERFADGRSTFPHQDAARIKEIVAGQHPYASILSCSDSRVPVEMVFDAGFGDLFVVRAAGNVAGAYEIGTIEYGIEHLGSNLIVVLGHSRCGAVTAATNGDKAEGAIASLLNEIEPAVARCKESKATLKGSDLVTAAVTENVWLGIESLIQKSSTIRSHVQDGSVQIVGAIYHLEDSKVEWLGSHPRQKELVTSILSHCSDVVKTEIAPIVADQREVAPEVQGSTKATLTLGNTVNRQTDSSGVLPLTQKEWASLVADVAALKAENARFRAQLANRPAQYVSTDDTPIPVGDQDSLVAEVENLSARVDELAQQQAKPAEASQTIKPGLGLSGFVDGSNYTNHNTRTNTFGLDQVEVDVQKSLFATASVRADIEFVNNGTGGFNMGLEQGFMSWGIGTNWKWQFTFGKFNAPLGFESIDPVDMYQYSYGLVTARCLPTNLTGVMATLTAPKLVDWSVFAVNGWDVNSDNNKSKSLGAHIGFSPIQNLNTKVAVLTGPELSGNESSRRTVLDCDLTYKPSSFWTVGADFNMGWETKYLADNGTAQWNGFLLMSNVQFAQRFGVTVRTDYLNDKGGSRTGAPQEQKAICVSPSVKIVDGLTGLLEVRYDWSNHATFTNAGGGAKQEQASTAFEFTYGF
jgi:carbonic anhydrase